MSFDEAVAYALEGHVGKYDVSSFEGLRERNEALRRFNEWEKAQPRRYRSLADALAWFDEALKLFSADPPPVQRDPEETAARIRRQRAILARFG